MLAHLGRMAHLGVVQPHLLSIPGQGGRVLMGDYCALKVLVVDDFGGWRKAVRTLLRLYMEKFEFVGEAGDGLEAVEQARKLRPHIVLLDICLPGLNGFEAAKQIESEVPEAKILFLTQNSSSDLAHAALNNGVKGYVLKMDAGRELWPAIKAVLQGRTYISGSIGRSWQRLRPSP